MAGEKTTTADANSSTSNVETHVESSSVGKETKEGSEAASDRGKRVGFGLGRGTIVGAVIVLFAAVSLGIFGSGKSPEEIAKYPEQLVKSIAEDEKLRNYMENLREDENLRYAFDRIRSIAEDLRAADVSGDHLRPGLELKASRKASTPVVIIPGFTSSMLEIWSSKPCASGGFRRKLWGSTECVAEALRNTICWLEHLGLDPKTWRDPEGIKLRPVEGMSSMDYLMPGYFVWAKVFENLADVGYDPSSLKVFPFDWRIPPQHDEDRDGLLSRIKAEIEIMYRMNGDKRVCIMGHSMGNQMVLYFLNWASEVHGHAWLTKYVDSWVNISGPLLGVPKAVTVVLSGESRDTVDIGRIGAQFTRGKFMVQIVDAMRTFGSLPWMFPRGTDAMWHHQQGDGIFFSPTVQQDLEEWYASMNQTEDLQRTKKMLDTVVARNYSSTDLPDLLRIVLPDYMKLVDQYFNLDAELSTNPRDPRTWTNPLAKALPFRDPKSKVYCLYGHATDNAQTEYGYYYDVNRAYPALLRDIPLMLHRDSKDEGLVNSMQMRPHGDGTVTLASLGYTCLALWKEQGPYNPYGAETIIREYANEPISEFHDAWTQGMFESARGGPNASTHIELLGNHDMLRDVLMIVTEPKAGGEDEPLQERIISPLREFVEAAQSKSR